MAILGLAALLRLVGIGYGLPLAVLNPDEASIVPRAWRMGQGHLDPGWYDYPSLLMGLLAPVQAVAGSPSYEAARLVAVLIGLGGVAATWWLGRRAYGTGAAIVGAAAVAVATTHVAYSRVAVTDVLLTLVLTCVLVLAVEGRIEWAGLAVGLAASAKYPGALAAVPVVVAGWGRWRAVGKAAALAAAGFILTSPFVLLHARAAWDDVSRVQRLARAGWLGFENDPIAPLAYLDRLWEAIGPLLVLAVVGVVAAFVRRSRTDLILLSFALVYWLTLMPQAAHFDRYALPLVPVLAVLAGSIRVLVPVALVVLVVPLAWSIGDARELTNTDTRLRADAWVATNIPQADAIAADPSTLPLAGRIVVRLELPGPGRPSDPARDLKRLRAQGVKWVILAGSVTDRVLAAPDRYPQEALFYEQLGHGSEPAFAVSPDEPGLAGPWVRVYRISR
ncbi:glycosyltransferase family 39 protein [Gaiella sp.]|uniref:glycosyltransferase family 39 protein n=1 Tax=Gaiella sp. TaxID=2663207 RepID=UPI00398388D7